MNALSADDAKKLTERLKLFAQPQRLMILAQLLDGPRAVSELESGTGIGQPTLSQQLGVLRRAGILRTERESRAIFYSFAEPEEENWVRSLFGVWNTQSGLYVPPRGASPRPHASTREDVGAIFARVGVMADRD
ncbi:MAG: metalloregulator ArsR/SmtB family transcription factor [Acetobacter sp.]|uniref:ArsR/SmtB family transcription factor n=1 Tax=Acetobacter sp. TaxID=440 RepID=UPI0039EBCAB9